MAKKRTEGSIRIGNFSIRADAYCWALDHIRVVTNKKTGKQSEGVARTTYHPTLPHLATYLGEEWARQIMPACNSIADLVDGLKAALSEVEQTTIGSIQRP